MSKFAYFNPHDGRVLQWIDTEAMNYNLPDAWLLHACSDAEWGLQSDGEMMVKDGAVVPYVVPLPDVSPVKAAALVAVDAAAGTARARHITTADGQGATYLLKAADADRYKAAGYPAAQIAGYPWVLAKARAMVAAPAAADYQAAADLIIATRDAWVVKGAAIEEARERGKAAVSAAVDVAGVAAARSAAVDELMLL